MSVVPREKAGAGAAVNNSVRQIGGALGVAILGRSSPRRTRPISGRRSTPCPPSVRAERGQSIVATLAGGRGAAGRRETRTPHGPPPVVEPAREAFIVGHARHSRVHRGSRPLAACIVLCWLPGRRGRDVSDRTDVRWRRSRSDPKVERAVDDTPDAPPTLSASEQPGLPVPSRRESRAGRSRPPPRGIPSHPCWRTPSPRCSGSTDAGRRDARRPDRRGPAAGDAVRRRPAADQPRHRQLPRPRRRPPRRRGGRRRAGPVRHQHRRQSGLNGTTRLHLALEEELADHYGTETAVLTSSGVNANVALLSTVGGPETSCWSTGTSTSLHAAAAASRGTCPVPAQRPRSSLIERFETIDPRAGAVVVVDGVYSMTGEAAPLAEIADLCARYGARLVVDEAHGLGVLGKTGRGAAEQAGVLPRVDAVTVAFSKSLASVGGAIMTSRAAAEGIRASAMPYVFSAANDPASVGAALTALRILRSEPSGWPPPRERRAAAPGRSTRPAPPRHGGGHRRPDRRSGHRSRVATAFDAGVYQRSGLSRRAARPACCGCRSWPPTPRNSSISCGRDTPGQWTPGQVPRADTDGDRLAAVAAGDGARPPPDAAGRWLVCASSWSSPARLPSTSRDPALGVGVVCSCRSWPRSVGRRAAGAQPLAAARLRAARAVRALAGVAPTAP